MLSQVSDPNWIRYGTDDPPIERKSGVRLIELRIARERGFVHLVLENISKKLVREIPSLLVDMLEIGSYVYAADQATRRGGETLPREGRDWRRELRFDIPVSTSTLTTTVLAIGVTATMFTSAKSRCQSCSAML